MDLYCMRISNRWIFASLLAGFYICRMEEGIGVTQFILGLLIPLLLLGWLFCFHMLGPGDIKLFCVLGGIMGPRSVMYCMGLAFLSGAFLSFAVLVSCGGFGERLRYLMDYLERCPRTGSIRPYYRKGGAWENIHFTVPIFMSVMLYAGGMY